ncbi:ABC transporter ATP-binding protein [Ruicaihuangia caeni]|uniref:ABC transporter ATP-binding protein n=1 Tax=Ruicaihuangia caeni TaxID=3042517 RepID=A0AAW6T6H2_9MICO|nr:ABC transporter ATP-binding protein [Klugiella sp. YN-L-19]MDI2099382.1 ABC transporter ATP-binding protein [Klugiella sp. YN-L-19]
MPVIDTQREERIAPTSAAHASADHSAQPGRPPHVQPFEEPTAEGIRFRKAAKTYRGGTEALSSTSFAVAPGEFVSLVGPSGCGKSTLLRLASGLDTVSSGSVEVNGEVGYIFQDASLLPWRTVQRNVELLAELEGIDRATRRALAADAIALTGLAGFEQHRPLALSGGMRMRVSIARALTLRPGVFLFDEPFGALDEISRERLNDELLAIFARERFAGLFVTHSIAEAVYLSTRVLVMSARPGRIVAELEVPFDHDRSPALRFDAAFSRVASEVSEALRAHS